MLPSQKGYCFGSALFLYLNRNAGFNMKKIKRFICIIMSVIIIVGAPMTSYMEARAVEVIGGLSLLEQLLIAAGISFGLGEQSNFFTNSRQNGLDEYMRAAAEGGVFTLPNFGEIDFSDSRSIMRLFDASIRINSALLSGDPSYMDSPLNDVDAAYADALLQYDKISYHNTGTCASNAMNDSISEFYDDYNGSSEALAGDIQDCFSVIMKGGDFTSVTDDEKSAHMLKIWNTFNAVLAAGMVGFGNTALPISSLKEYSGSEFSEYDVVFGESYFDGKYATNADGNYIYSISGEGEGYRFVFDKVAVSVKIVGVIQSEQNRVYFYMLGHNGNLPFLSNAGLRISQQIVLASGKVYENGKSYTYCPYGNYSGNTPLYSDEDAALNALLSGDFSDAENIQSSYADFKSNTEGAGVVVGGPFSNYVASLKSLSDIFEIIPAVREASDTYGGTAKALEEVADILNQAASAAVVNPDDDPGGSSNKTNYSGILSRILAAINNLLTTTKSIPLTLVTLLAGKFMTSDALENLINSLPSMFVVPFSAMIDLALKPVIASIDAVPVLMNATLSDIFPDSIAAGKALISIPVLLNEGFAATVEAVSGISIDIPDIAIPDIVIPDIVIPDVVIPDIAIPDVVIPAITLNPAFAVTVANDYTGLSDIISGAVSGVMTDVFVPDEAVALEKVGEMQEYFKFKDDMEDIIYTFKKKVFGIKPDPVLKIPIGKPTSKKYNFGTDSYIIIDVSWYAHYKDFGDKIILAFAWAFFIWRIFVHLPGIISGGVGGIQTIGDAASWHMQNKSRDN